MSLSPPVPTPSAARPQAKAAPRFEGRLARMALLFAALMLAVAWAAVAAVLTLKWHDAIDAELRQNTNLARAFEEQTVRVLASVDQATVRVRDAVAAGHPVQLDLVRYAGETGLAPKILVQLSLIDASGRFVASNLDPDGQKTGPVDLSTREHVQVHLAAPAPGAGLPAAGRDALFIGKPVLGKVSKRWTIQLSRRIAAADGRLLGVVVASLDPSYFEDVFRRVSLGRQGGLSLLGTDLGIRARVIGGQSSGMGSSLSPTGALARAGAAREGQFRGESSVDGIARIVAFRRVADYPLLLAVTTAEQEALADWRTTRNTTLVLTVLLSAAVAAGAAVFVFNLRRMERTNDALRRSELQANATNQAKSEFLAAISHELRTPLTSIRGFAELMEHRLDQPRFRDMAGLIRKGAEHLNALLTQILDLAKVEAGAMPVASEAQDLRMLVQGSADFFALGAQAKGLSLTVQLAPELPSALVCDGLRLKQILNNLLSNAIKFTETGGVQIAVERIGDEIAIHVDDSGPGIPAALHETIFEKFRQAHDRISYQHGGTGLGLALSRGLAELMHGRLGVGSSSAGGARFTLVLPIAASAA
jgi:signal transduction histidine kinase